jgi:hypothetical protein
MATRLKDFRNVSLMLRLMSQVRADMSFISRSIPLLHICVALENFYSSEFSRPFSIVFAFSTMVELLSGECKEPKPS